MTHAASFLAGRAQPEARRPLVSTLAIGLAMAIAVSSCGGDSPPTAESGSTTDLSTTTSTEATTTTTDPADLLAAATRGWHTLVATSLGDPIALRDPVIAPNGELVAASVRGQTVRIWIFSDVTWEVAEQVVLDGVEVLETDGVAVPGLNEPDPLVASEWAGKLRLLIAGYYGNGVAVAAVEQDGVEWRVLRFSVAGEMMPFGHDAWLTHDGGIVMAYNDCAPACASGTVTEVPAESTDYGYRFAVPVRRSAPPASRPDSSAIQQPGAPCSLGAPDCVENPWGDGVNRTIIGWDECQRTLGDIPGACEDLDMDGYAGYPDSN
jgi:hypothetical protein